MTTMHIPVDSADAREQREIEWERANAAAAEQRDHDRRCQGGWLGLDEDERPIPCRRCRPDLVHVACRSCGVGWRSCENLNEIRRGPCCTGCDHQRPALASAPTASASDDDDETESHDEEKDARRWLTAGATVEAQIIEPLRVRIPGDGTPMPLERFERLLLVVEDPDLGSVAVRWRIPPAPEAWVWRCTGCGTRTRKAECGHTFTAALHIAETFLGLEPIAAHLRTQRTEETA